MQKPLTTPHDTLRVEAHLVALKRQVYLGLNGCVSCGILLTLLYSELTTPTTLTRVTSVLLLSIMLGGLLLLWRKPHTLILVERGLLASGCLALLGVLAFGLFVTADPARHEAIFWWFSAWVPLVLTCIFMVLGSRQGLSAALMLLLLSLGLIAGHEWQSANEVHAQYLVQFGFASIAFLAALYAFARSLERETEARVAAATLAQYALLDPLTGLTNRHGFSRELETLLLDAQTQGTEFAVVLLGLDSFKHINDHYGYRGGDTLLQGVATRLKSALCGSETLARISGDEFALLLPYNEADEIKRAVGRVQMSLRTPHALNGYSVTLTSSVGISFYPAHSGSAETLLVMAETAMHNAKREGKNRSRVFKESPGHETMAMLDLGNLLPFALVRQELYLVYQPLINLSDGSISGAEALVRWQHPSLGNIPPSVFIPLAEANHMIVPLGTWVLTEACRQAKAWLDAGIIPFRVSVNVSAAQFAESDFVATVRQVLTETRLPPGCLELELTESIVAQASAARRLAQLRDMGIVVALDDFGTGYSSLGQLQNLPLDTLKIDRSFLAALEFPLAPHQKATVLLQTILTLAQGLGLSVIAEGVETAEQADYLRERGCEFGQGYYFARPLKVADLEPLLETSLRTASLLDDETLL